MTAAGLVFANGMTLSDIERTLACLGSIASVVGLGITILVLRKVRRIEQSYTRQGMVPHLRSKLSANAKNLKKYNRGKLVEKIGAELAKTRANLQSLLRALPEGERLTVQELLNEVSDELRKTASSRSDERANQFVDKINVIVQQITNLEEEWKWSSRDAS